MKRGGSHAKQTSTTESSCLDLPRYGTTAPAMKSLILLLALVVATAQAQLRPWNDYKVILWMSGAMAKHQAQWPLITQRLHELGITTGMSNRDTVPQHLIDSGFDYYV